MNTSCTLHFDLKSIYIIVVQGQFHRDFVLGLKYSDFGMGTYFILVLMINYRG